jgi:hypothetical protein
MVQRSITRVFAHDYQKTFGIACLTAAFGIFSGYALYLLLIMPTRRPTKRASTESWAEYQGNQDPMNVLIEGFRLIASGVVRRLLFL